MDGKISRGMAFGPILNNGGPLTLCALTRYGDTGTSGRILTSPEENFLHGHWQGNVGVAHWGSWKTGHGNQADRNDWINLCGQNTYGHQEGSASNSYTFNWCLNLRPITRQPKPNPNHLIGF